MTAAFQNLPTDDEEAKAEIKRRLAASPRLAHSFLFAHRHPNVTPEFHYQMIDDWHSSHPHVLSMAFRGGAKSTIAEEAITTLALQECFRNGLVLGENQPRALERLGAIKNELETNERIHAIYGDQVGPIWGEQKIELRNGTYLQALGRDQSLRGVKHKDKRPDVAFVDDYEDEESVQTPEARAKVRKRFYSVLIPALDHAGYKLRVAGTPLDNDSLIMHLYRAKQWLSRKFPIEYVDGAGTRQATWADRFPLAKVDELKAMYTDAGELNTYMREYMCEAEDVGSKPFTAQMFKQQNLTHTWEPCYALYDPARTTNQATSAHTGRAVVSWIGNRLVVWESGGEFWKPDEIVTDLFRVDAQYSPIAVGIEDTGLNEFLLQPIRHEQLRRGHPLPLRPLHAPKNKLDFIKGLQPFAKAGEIILVGEQPQLLSQFDNFPRGRIDILNALAYVQKIRMGQPVYGSFGYQNVALDLSIAPASPLFLACNAAPGGTTAALIQVVEGRLHVLADWVSELPPGDCLVDFAREAGLVAGKKFKCVIPQAHYSGFSPLGMLAAARKGLLDTVKGGDDRVGREEIRSLIERQPKGFPGVSVAQSARWSLRAMTGGYARTVGKDGRLLEEPMDNVYKTLLVGIEATMALTRLFENDGDSGRRLAYTSDGRAFTSARIQPERR